MKNMSIKAKLLLVIIPLIIMQFVSIAVFSVSVNKTITQSEEMYLNTLYKINSDLVNADRDLYQALTAGSSLYNSYANNPSIVTPELSKQWLEEYDENLGQVDKRVNEAVDLAKGNEDLWNKKSENGKTFGEISTEFQKTFDSWKSSIDFNNYKNISVAQFSTFAQDFDEVRGGISELTDITEAWAETEKDVMKSSIMTTLIISIAILLVISIILLVFGIVIIRSIGNGVQTVSKRLVKLSKYDLSDEPLKVNSGDEIGTMKKALNDTEEALEQIVGVLRNTSDGLVVASDTVSEGTDATGTGIDNVSSAADELANASTSMAQDVSDISMNMTELSDIMDRSVSSAKSLSEASNKIEEVTDKGNAVVEQLAGINEKSYVEFNAIFDAIEDIKASGAKISEASELILNIADQTNLLSLNASIEAARAGEAGKGFAVVADEIRKLSDESKENVDTINEILSELTAATNNAAKKADVVKDFVHKQNDAVGETKDSFDAIVESVESVEDAIAELERVNEELNNKSREIDESVSNLSALSQENAATSEQLSATALTVQNSVNDLKVTQGDVASSSGDLSSIVGKFVLADAPATQPVEDVQE